jgi:acetylornithine aminotransferase
VVATAQVAEILEPGDHGTTFGGNPLAAAAALKVLEIIERDNLLEHARQIYTTAEQHYEPLKRKVRGRGALIAIEVHHECSSSVAKLASERGVIVNAVNPSWIRIAPALNIDLKLLEEGLTRLDQALEEVENEQH